MAAIDEETESVKMAKIIMAKISIEISRAARAPLRAARSFSLFFHQHHGRHRSESKIMAWHGVS
jgi:hypothetical protein